MAVGAVAGGTGSIAGDGTAAGLSGQSFTPGRAGLDLASGALGGAVGTAVGSMVGSRVMSYALEKGLSRGAVTALGAVSSGVFGGAAGAAASAVVTSAAYGQPFFSSSLGMNMLIGAVAGGGGALIGSAAYSGLAGEDDEGVGVMPSEPRLGGGRGQSQLKYAIGGMYRIRQALDFSPSDNSDVRSYDVWDNATANKLLRGGPRAHAILIHGSSSHLFPETEIGGLQGVYRQPMTPEAFADLLRNNYGLGGTPGNPAEINLWSCYAARLGYASVAQRLATALHANVYAPASRNDIGLDYNGAWIKYTP